MIRTTMQITLVIFMLFIIIGDSVKIGISKPASVAENITTTETIETTTLEPITTTASTSTSTTTKKIQTTKIKTTQTTPTTTITSTTPIPSTSTTSAPQKNDSKSNPIRKNDVDRSGYFCSCDLRPNFCDINCCCDIDCMTEELKSFDCHTEETRLEDFYYQQGLPPCNINEGWLCVFRTNVDNSKKNHHNYILDRTSFHEWPQLLLENTDLAKDRSFYKIGEPILFYNLDANEIIEFDLPFSLVGHECQIFESTRHLESRKTSCHLPLENAKILETTLYQKLSTSFLLQRPNIEIPQDGIIKETQNEFIPISIFRCNKEFDCIPVSINNSSLDIFDDSAYSSMILTKITHNITHLINCNVLFVRSEEKSTKVWQDYEVKYVHINETAGAPLNISGPLGYIAGSPLIIGHKVLFNESAESIDSNQILDYFHPNRTNRIHIFIPKRRKERCEESHQLTLNYGESILIQCLVQLDNSTELTSEANFTKICSDLQERSLQHLQVKNILDVKEDFLISMLGNPANKTEYWTKIEVRNYENLPIVGIYLDKEDAFICQNMILGLKYEFLTVQENLHGIRHQNILQRASIEMGKRHDLQFQLDELVSIPITFATVFQNLQDVNNAMKLRPFSSIMLLVILFYFNFFYQLL